MTHPPLRILALAVGFAVALIFLYRSFGIRSPLPALNSNPLSTSIDDLSHVSPETQTGGAISGHIANETVKAELGRAAWKLFHTTMAQFPEKPSEDESAALKSYVYLFARLYPCGQCAAHFQQILQEYPPQTSSRNSAAGWACFVHNKVNQSKGKDLFDCNKIGEFYDCGCSDDDDGSGSMTDGSGPPAHGDKTTRPVGEELSLDDFKPGQIVREGSMNGG